MASSFDDPLAPSPCEQCGNATESTIRCSVRDSKNLCQNCFHDLPQATRKDIGDPECVCDIHHKVDIFCKTCQLGCCKECAVNVHKDHKLVDMFKLVEETRRDLTEQLQKVSAREERLLELRRKIESSLRKIEETPKLVNKLIDEIKEEVAQNLQKEFHRIQRVTQPNIIYYERRRDSQLKLAKEKADLDIQRIEEIQGGIRTPLLEDAEKRRCKIQKAESNLLVGQQACESANLEIKSLLESHPKKLACRGRQLSSLVKASSAFQCQDDVLESCREVEDDLPKFKIQEDNFFKGLRPFSPLVKVLLCIFVVVFFANNARGFQRDEQNSLLSLESINSFIMLCSYFSICHAIKFYIFMFILVVTKSEDYPIKRKESSAKEWKYFISIVQFVLGFGLLTVLLTILVSSISYLYQVKAVSANIESIISILQSCSLLYGMRNSKTLKDYCDYQNLNKF